MTTLFPFTPNWRDSYSIVYEFSTDILVSRSGKEQRRALRITPRKTIEHTIQVKYSTMRAFERFMSSSQVLPLLAPEIPFGPTTQGELTATGTVVRVDFIPPWLADGATTILVYRKQTALATVASHSGSNLTFTASTGLDWPAGTRLCKPLTGLLANSLSGSALTNAADETSVVFNVDPASQVVDDGSPGTLQCAGYEVFPFVPNWSTPVALTFGNPTDTVDFGFGKIETYVPVAFNNVTRQASFLSQTRTDAILFYQFFARMRGQQGEFYFPSGQFDLVLANTTNAGDSVLHIVGTDDYNAYASDTVHRALIVDMNDGTRYPHRIASFAISGGNTQITLDTPAEVDFSIAAVKRVSWMPRARFASDQLTLEFLTDSVMQTKITIQTLEDLDGS